MDKIKLNQKVCKCCPRFKSSRTTKIKGWHYDGRELLFCQAKAKNWPDLLLYYNEYVPDDCDFKLEHLMLKPSSFARFKQWLRKNW